MSTIFEPIKVGNTELRNRLVITRCSNEHRPRESFSGGRAEMR